MANRKRPRVKLNKVWLETGHFDRDGRPVLKEITNQVKLVCNLLSAADSSKSDHFFKICYDESKRLTDEVFQFFDDDFGDAIYLDEAKDND